MFDRIKKYCDFTAPSGYEFLMHDMIQADIEPYADSVEAYDMGNLVAFKKGKHTPSTPIVVSAHMDEVGMMVSHIADDGRIYFSPVGGIDRRVLLGKRVVIGDDHIDGVIASKAMHILPKAEQGKCDDSAEMYIDIGASSRDEVLKYIDIGDYAALIPNYAEFGDGFIRSKAIDDRLGCAVLAELIRQELEYDTYFAFCVSEECGCFGAQAVCKRIGPGLAVVVESTTAGDISGAPEHKKACCLREGAVVSHMDNGTIYDRETVDAVMALAAEKGIRAQLKNIVAGGNEAKAYQTSSAACKVIAVSCPTRYIHSPACVAAKQDMQAVYELVAAIIERGI